MSAGGSEGDIRVMVEAAGTDEAIESIDQTEESLNEAGESMGNTADEMQGLTRQMKGLGMALAASLAIAAGGLLSQVPVLGAAMSGLKAIIQALAFQMDQFIRSIGGEGLNEFLFDTAAAIYNLDGSISTAVGSIATLTAVLAPLGVLLAKLGVTIGGVSGGWLTFAVAAGAVVGVLTVLAARKIGILGWIRDLGAATRGAYEDLKGLRGRLGDLVAFADKHTGQFAEMVSVGWDETKEDIQDVLDTITGFDASGITDDIAGEFNDLADNAYGFGQGLIEEFKDGIESKKDDLLSTVDNVAGAVRDKLPGSPAKEGPLSDLDQTGPGMVETFASGIEANVGRAGSAATSLAGAADDGASGFSADRGSSPPVVRMDGRRLTQQDSRYRRNGTAQRGRNG